MWNDGLNSLGPLIMKRRQFLVGCAGLFATRLEGAGERLLKSMSASEPRTTPVLDWHGVYPGYASYDKEGNYFPQDMPRGIKLSVEQAVLTEPVFQRQKRWERSSVHYPAVLREKDRFRLWYEAWPDVDDAWVRAGNIPGKYPILWCYAESTDGFNWERPELAIYSFDGSTANNIIMAGSEVGTMGYFHLLRNPKGGPEERYIATGIEGEYKIDGRPRSRNTGILSVSCSWREKQTRSASGSKEVSWSRRGYHQTGCIGHT